jgi:hypothetical protein
VTTQLPELRRSARLRRAFAYWGVLLGLYASLALGAALSPPAWLHTTALFGHLASVIIGLGAAVVLEFTGVMWIRAARTLDELRRTETLASIVAWIGIIGLLGTGAFLQPDLTEPLTAIKMIAVLVVALNGVAVSRLAAELRRLPPRIRFASLPVRLKRWCIWSAVISQAGWWTAVLLGMLNTAPV